MIKSHWIILFLVAIYTSACTSDPWSLETDDQYSVDIEELDQNVVLMFITPDCPLSQSYAKRFSTLSQQFSDLKFFGVLPGTTYTKEEIDHFSREYGFKPQILLDKKFSLSSKLDAETTPHFFVLDDQQNKLYEGALDDWAVDLGRKKVAPTQHYLKDALYAITTGQKVKVKKTKPVGCIIEYE